MYVGAVEEMMCVVYVIAGMIRERVMYLFWLGKGVTSEAGKYLFRAANV